MSKLSRTNMLIVVFIGALIATIAGVYFFSRMQHRDYYSEIVLIKGATVAPDWLEIESEGRIKLTKDRHFISVLLEPSFRLDAYARTIVAPDGRKINPEIILVDSDTNEYQLTYLGGRRTAGGEYAEYGYEGGLPANRQFSRVRLRSEFPIVTKSILWSGYDVKDLP